MPSLLLLAFFATIVLVNGDDPPACVDLNPDCREWVLNDQAQCENDPLIKRDCLKSCGICISPRLKRRFDVNQLQPNLRALEWLVGIWKNENGGKAFFPTIPKFTFGEQIEISIPSSAMSAVPALNYTTFAWSMDKTVFGQREELHSEEGFITVNGNTAALSTVMSNGFVTVEEGQIGANKIRFRLVDIGRISFSRDLPVHDLIREWTLLDRRTLEARLSMSTLTHKMLEHTHIIYTKVFP